MEFDIVPHQGIGPISFGMSRKEVSSAMAWAGGGLPSARSTETDCYFRNAFQVTFGNSGAADFIEVASALAAEVIFAGQDVFDMPADELLRLIQHSDQPDPDLSRPPYSFIFPNLILTLWGRDTQYDHKGGQRRPMYAAVGVGAPTYLAAIRAIRRKRH